MAKRMLIDATHPEEVRVVVHNENKLEDFDFETQSKKQLKGNIYLARVTRVEPSLQAAFVEYGGNRHGFLPFSEIHPDYYRVPVADRDSIMEEEAVVEPQEEEENNASQAEEDTPDVSSDSLESVEKQQDDTIEEIAGETSVDSINEDESDFETKTKSRVNLMKRYKIQEVIKRRQVILVQVAKEERGNKGAALTTYLSLAGRYSVLMPNTNKGGGISRKISNPNDRKRLKDILSELKIPEGIAVIVRTAGSQRTKMEIKRDYEYLIRLWNEIRENTLKSEAPNLIYEEANLIKRAMRDLYTSDMEEILVEGERGYKMAKSCMRSLMPSHAKKVKHYKGMQVPLYHRFQVETQIDAMHNPIVQLKSGGYLVINPTEALVAVDVNSGRATKERHIEETAFKTNQEAADEVARQVRLRDLAGLLVIDFIDMDDPKHNREVERRLKDAMQADRARIQLGRISPFGLLEMSRQRLRPSIVENSTLTCPHCDGIGTVRTTESAALHALRALEEDGIRKGSGKVALFVPTEVALYILNQKRSRLIEIEQRYNFTVDINADNSIVIPNFRLERLIANNDGPVDEIMPLESVKSAQVKSTRNLNEERPERSEHNDRQDGDPKRRRRRRRRKDRSEFSDTDSDENVTSSLDENQSSDNDQDASRSEDGFDDDGRPRKRRRRGKRGGRRRTRRPEGEEEQLDSPENQSASEADNSDATAQKTDATSEITQETSASSEDKAPDEEKPKRRRGPRRRKATTSDVSAEETPTQDTVAVEPTASTATTSDADSASESVPSTEAQSSDDEDKPKKSSRAPRKRATTTRRPRKKAGDEAVEKTTKTTVAPSADTVEEKVEAATPASETETSSDSAPKAKPRTRTRAKAATKTGRPVGRPRKTATPAAEKTSTPSAEVKNIPIETPVAKIKTESKPEPKPVAVATESASVQTEAPKPAQPSGPKKKGWWSRITGN
ncbi:Rne/Rng family ribonuclease [Kiloniella sp. EL199]|uniref:Rne/Rng family ribonuclease n=1 Tax=Kiloniella sp. EL199 TaxID=2107581 RepID=UPI000EA3F990|nr:Rne/Rng family ribonuclease [Kiloniella sp. EL199]